MGSDPSLAIETLGSDPIVTFWFAPPREKWFRKDAAFDEEIRRRFGELHARAARGELEGWRSSREGRLALVIVLDQFSRNLYRDDARAFAQDEQARDVARQALSAGDEAASSPFERQFLYLPFEHSEDLADQDTSVALFRKLEEYPETRGLTEWAVRHRDIVARFGRFPHRNAALGRPTTDEERAFLEQPGSRF